jgi:DNA polymerase-3 subunit gamma/tau
MAKTEHVALYRKYRPSDFNELLGQEHITSVLKGEIEKGAVAHAYLFAGPRGTGKTSTARILARAIGTTENDLYEIDAASNRKIDEMRALREAVLALPFESPKKVYILDEVHMLTSEAFNAFLKTLEEPPAHVVFILATTDPEKVPETILSRCEVFTFKKPSQTILAEMILKTAKKEGITLDRPAADLIALLAEGSFRDAHGTLQKILSSASEKKVTLEEVERVTGSPKGSMVNQILEGIAKSDIQKSLEALESASEGNVDLKLFLRLVLEKCRAVLLFRFAPELKKSMEEKYSVEDIAFLRSLADEKGSKLNSNALRELLIAYGDLSYAAIPQIPIELALMKIINSNE